MNRWVYALFFCLLFATGYGQNKVVIANIHGTIDLGMVPYIKKSIQIAEKDSARALIFHVNTFGGRIDAATQIKDAILNAKIPTVAFIDKRAISAGALISLSCRKIAMTEGATIGAATAVDMQGKKASEKVQSFMRAEMAAIAERNKRDGKICEAMVDEDIEIKNIVQKGKLLTLTTEQALKVGIADYHANSLPILLDSLGLKNTETLTVHFSWAESVVRFLTNPVISSLLLSLGMIGLFFEIKSPGWGVPGTFGVLFLALFFGSHYIVDLSSIIELLMVISGIVLILLEIFVIPGFGVAGILGFILLLTGLFLSMFGRWETVDMHTFVNVTSYFSLAILVFILVFILFLFKLHKVPFWKKVGLNVEEKAEDGYNMVTLDKTLEGKEGIAVSYLRPVGIVEIDKKRYNAQTLGDFVPKGEKVTVISVEGNRLYVELLKQQNV